MKIFMFIIMFTLLSVKCGEQSGKDILKFQYEAYTRGSTFKIEIDKDSIRVREGLRGATQKSSAITAGQWEELLLLCKNLELTGLSELQAPSSGRFSDAAAHAELEVLTEKEVYTSSGFDHGAPPDAIAPLVKAMITLAETVE